MVLCSSSIVDIHQQRHQLQFVHVQQMQIYLKQIQGKIQYVKNKLIQSQKFALKKINHHQNAYALKLHQEHIQKRNVIRINYVVFLLVKQKLFVRVLMEMKEHFALPALLKILRLQNANVPHQQQEIIPKPNVKKTKLQLKRNQQDQFV